MARISVIGAGINGLVTANYLARRGNQVTLFERKAVPGGACNSAVWENEGVSYEYPQGASVLGLMPDFILKETGLTERIELYTPDHPEILLFGKNRTEYVNEDGSCFAKDREKVAQYLRDGYRAARPPSLSDAEAKLGKDMSRRWITGSARELLDYYDLSEHLRLFYAVSVIESGPVSFDSPYSAFTIPLMASGSVFGGAWGYVKGGIWQIPRALDSINEELGVERVYSADVLSINEEEVRYQYANEERSIKADYVILATDPLTAAKLCGEQSLVDVVSKKEMLGTSGKLMLLFKEPVQWKGDTGSPDFASAFRHIIPVESLDELQVASQAAAKGEVDYVPGYFEIYSEGAGDRAMGGKREYDLVSVFFKSLAFGARGAELEEVKRKVLGTILPYIENPGSLLHAILETPKDIAELFYFPGGNIDAIEIAAGQTFSDRTFSSDPNNAFYQFGTNPRTRFCGAAAYPCGSVAGTPGYMCAAELMRGL